MLEIHGPALIDGIGKPHGPPLGGSDPFAFARSHLWTLFLINPLYPFVVDRPTLAAQQDMKPAIAKPTPLGGQIRNAPPQQPIIR